MNCAYCGDEMLQDVFDVVLIKPLTGEVVRLHRKCAMEMPRSELDGLLR